MSPNQPRTVKNMYRYVSERMKERLSDVSVNLLDCLNKAEYFTVEESIKRTFLTTENSHQQETVMTNEVRNFLESVVEETDRKSVV